MPVSQEEFEQGRQHLTPSLLAIVGPTATGKSRLALDLARRFEGEIVSADSCQVHRHMDVGTAKPSPEERQRVPHHLVDIIDPGTPFDLGAFLRLAHGAIEDISRRGRLPLVVGGTGQYVWALLEGWQLPQVTQDPALRKALEEEAGHLGPEALHQRLGLLDPEVARRIDPRNIRRVVRALEVHHATECTPQGRWEKGPPPFRWLVIGLTMERRALYRRIDQRVDEMVKRGLVEEVQGLLKRGYHPDLPAFSSIGYKEIIAHLQGQVSLEEATSRIKTATHRLARHQYAWFRLDDPRIHWLDAEPLPLERAEGLVRRFLAESSLHGTMASDTARGGP